MDGGRHHAGQQLDCSHASYRIDPTYSVDPDGAGVAAHEYGLQARWAITSSSTSIGNVFKMDVVLY
jgi:hypothetical protein